VLKVGQRRGHHEICEPILRRHCVLRLLRLLLGREAMRLVVDRISPLMCVEERHRLVRGCAMSSRMPMISVAPAHRLAVQRVERTRMSPRRRMIVISTAARTHPIVTMNPLRRLGITSRRVAVLAVIFPFSRTRTKSRPGDSRSRQLSLPSCYSF
jgi:hypothetical protein